jgi:hypothetical protein
VIPSQLLIGRISVEQSASFEISFVDINYMFDDRLCCGEDYVVLGYPALSIEHLSPFILLGYIYQLLRFYYNLLLLMSLSIAFELLYICFHLLDATLKIQL